MGKTSPSAAPHSGQGTTSNPSARCMGRGWSANSSTGAPNLRETHRVHIGTARGLSPVVSTSVLAVEAPHSLHGRSLGGTANSVAFDSVSVFSPG